MNPCPDDKTLNRYLDGEVGPRRAARVRGHLAQCERCARRYADLRGVEEAVRTAEDEPARVPDLAARVTGDLARRGAFFRARIAAGRRRLFGRWLLSWRMLGAVMAAAVIVTLGFAGMDHLTQRQWARRTGPVLADAERVLVRHVYVTNEAEPDRLARAREEVRSLDLARRLDEVQASAEPAWARDLAPLAVTFTLMAEDDPLPEPIVHRLSDGGLLARACRLRETLARGG
ncbi:MAG: anti-sigma factor [Phycisphaerae bacterium]